MCAICLCVINGYRDMTEVFETLTGINMMQPYLLLDLPKS